MNEKIKSIVNDAISDVAKQFKKSMPKEYGTSLKLYGSDGVFDSVSLVTLIAEIEARLMDELNLEVVLADEKAMSQARSPFRDVDSLVNYVIHISEN